MCGNVRLVATDLDGTLLRPDARLGPRTRAALADASAAGLIVIPVTARPPHATWPVLGDAPVGPLAVCCNGAVLADARHRRVLGVERMPAELATALVARLRAALPGAVFASDDLAGFVHEPGFFDPPVEWEEERSEVGDLLAATAHGCIKLIVRRPGWSADRLLPRLGPALGATLAARVTATTAGADWVDLAAAGVTKARAMAAVCRRLGVLPAEVVAVGDHRNDLPLLAWAGAAAAVANAIPEVRAAAGRVLPSNRDEGVAALLEELVGSAAAAEAVTPRR